MASQEGKAFYLQTLSQSKNAIVGSFKIFDNLQNDPEILEALKSSVNSTVLLECRLTTPEKRENIGAEGVTSEGKQKALKAFKDTGAKVVFDFSTYSNVHLKILLEPRKALWISTTNFDIPRDSSGNLIEQPENGAQKDIRDFSIITTNQKLIAECQTVLDQLLQEKEATWGQHKMTKEFLEEDFLTWGPAQHQNDLHSLIKLAKKDIIIYQQDLQDEGIVSALIQKAGEGINVRILMSEKPFGPSHPNKSLPNLQRLSKNGVKVRLTGQKLKDNREVHIHAKVLVVDGTIMSCGGFNYFPDVLDSQKKNLNLGIITTKKLFLTPIQQQFEKDWADHEKWELKHKE